MSSVKTTHLRLTDAKSGLNLKSGKIELSLFANKHYKAREFTAEQKNEVDLFLSLLGGYNQHGRQFDHDKFKEIQQEFANLLYKANSILIQQLLNYSGAQAPNSEK